MQINGHLSASAILLFLVGGSFAEPGPILSTTEHKSTSIRQSTALARRGLIGDLVESSKLGYSRLRQEIGNLLGGSNSGHSQLRQGIEEAPVSPPASLPRAELSGYSREGSSVSSPVREGPSIPNGEREEELQSLQAQWRKIQKDMDKIDARDLRLGNKQLTKFTQLWTQRMDIEGKIKSLYNAKIAKIEGLEEQLRNIKHKRAEVDERDRENFAERYALWAKQMDIEREIKTLRETLNSKKLF